MDLRMDTTRAVLQLRQDGPAMLAAAQRAGLDAPVPSCPGWTVSDLLQHIGGIYASRVQILRERLQERPTRPAPPQDGLIEWTSAQLDELVGELRSVDPATQLWTFVGPRPATWWARRMAHETVVHRADAELAAGGPPPRVDAVVAVDGIDEALDLWLGLARDVGGGGERVGVRTPDERWLVTLLPDRAEAVRGADGDTDGLIAGTPSHVLYHLWGRVGADEVDQRGDAAAVDRLRRALSQSL